MIRFPRASQVTLVVKNQVANAGDVRSLGWEDPLKEGTTTHSSILAWRIPRTEEPGRLQSMGSQRVGHNSVTKQQQSIKISNYYAVNLKLIYCKSTILQLKKIKPLGRPP